MLKQQFKDLEAAKARVAAIEGKIQSTLAKELAGLPAAFGFDSAKAFIKAVKAATGAGGKAGRRTRATITPELRAQVKDLALAGKTGAEIAKATGISVPSVQNIKKQFGLVKARKKK